MKRVSLIRPSFFIWLIVPVAIWLSVVAFGLPHVIWSYEWIGRGRGYAGLEGRHYTRCTYVGPHGVIVAPAAEGRCAWVRFFHSQGGR
ncbi:hypothetical protein [Bosea sp. (in: a-proteobacteria)]|jgi:hypothetical protein|uniref:hypothetical protein n=1 Tax=Bosea sp. (in: a-proteobacteria) TaxID=1871050 RepID=UPI00356588B0